MIRFEEDGDLFSLFFKCDHGLGNEDPSGDSSGDGAGFGDRYGCGTGYGHGQEQFPHTSDLVLFPHLGRIQNQAQSIRSHRTCRSGNRRQGSDLFVHLFPSCQRVDQVRNQINSNAKLPEKGEVTWTTRNLSSLRQSPLYCRSPRSSSPSSQSFRNQYRRKHSMTRLCSKITTKSSIIAKEILKTAALSLFGAAIAFAAMGIEWVLR